MTSRARPASGVRSARAARAARLALAALAAFVAVPGANGAAWAAAPATDAPAQPTSAALAAALADASVGPAGGASAAAAASATAGSAPPAGAVRAQTIEPRAFGYVIGDVLTQRVRLDGAARDLAAASLPSAGRVGVWLERRPSRVETGADGRRWLVLSYQITNSPPSLTTIELPPLTLNLPGRAPLRVDAWPISIGPLAPDATAGGGDLQPMRPDRLPPRASVARIERGLYGSLGALAVVLIAWAAWWHLRNRREAARLPFARAWRDLRRADPHADPSADADAAAWRRLHRALDETAGRVVQHDRLAPLFARAPWLEPLREPLEQFYRQSAARFFGTGAPSAPYPLRQFARELYLAERRRQR